MRTIGSKTAILDFFPKIWWTWLQIWFDVLKRASDLLCWRFEDVCNTKFVGWKWKFVFRVSSKWTWLRLVENCLCHMLQMYSGPPGWLKSYLNISPRKNGQIVFVFLKKTLMRFVEDWQLCKQPASSNLSLMWIKNRVHLNLCTCNASETQLRFGVCSSNAVRHVQGGTGARRENLPRCACRSQIKAVSRPGLLVSQRRRY